MLYDLEGDRAEAINLGARLNLDVFQRVEVRVPGEGWDLWVFVASGRVGLAPIGRKAPGPIVLDFLEDSRLKRMAGAAHERRQPLAKAVGIGRGCGSVLDATAGFGLDAQMFAAWGCRVTATERSPVLAALWERALLKVNDRPEIKKILKDLHFFGGDARDLMTNTAESFDVVYLDPMYPERKRKSVAVKKEMQIFRRLVGDDQDAGELFEKSRSKAVQRVVVKRPKHAPWVAPVEPSFQVKGTTVRFDVYLS